MMTSAWIDGVRLRCDLKEMRGSLAFTSLSLSTSILLLAWQALVPKQTS
jgi:hypothetical protein